MWGKLLWFVNGIPVPVLYDINYYFLIGVNGGAVVTGLCKYEWNIELIPCGGKYYTLYLWKSLLFPAFSWLYQNNNCISHIG